MRRSLFWAATLASVSFITGCATHGGQIGASPIVTDPPRAGTLVIRRDGSWVGLFAPMQVALDDHPLYRLDRNESYSLPLDPGDYSLSFSIGLNECGGLVTIDPRQTLRLRLVPNCMIVEE